jgi:hypothetical protein
LRRTSLESERKGDTNEQELLQKHFSGAWRR